MKLLAILGLSLLAQSLFAALTVYPAPRECYEKKQISEECYKVQLKQGDSPAQTLPLYDFFDSYLYNKAATAEPHFGYFDSTGEVTVEVTLPDEVKTWVVRPQNAKVAGSLNGKLLTLTMRDDTRQIALEVNGDNQRPLLLFSNPMDPGPPTTGNKEIYLPDHADKEGVFHSGYHEKTNQWFMRHGGKEAYRSSTMYIAGGAVVAGQPVIQSNFNYTLRGRGILFSPLKDAKGKNVTVPLTIQQCGTTPDGSGVVNVDGIIIVSRAENWTTQIRSSDHVNFNNVKIIAEIRDGFDVINSQQVTAEGCFFMSHDDSHCLKGCWFGLNESVTDFSMKNTILANMGGGNPVRLGWEAAAPSISNAVYENIDVIYSKRGDPKTPHPSFQYQEAVIQINGANYEAKSCATFENIHFKNVRVEECADDHFIYLWGMSGDDRSVISDIAFTDCRFAGANPKPSVISGSKTCPIGEVIFMRCYTGEKLWTSEADAGITRKGEVANVRFANAH
jgi:hypothetical protein